MSEPSKESLVNLLSTIKSSLDNAASLLTDALANDVGIAEKQARLSSVVEMSETASNILGCCISEERVAEAIESLRNITVNQQPWENQPKRG